MRELVPGPQLGESICQKPRTAGNGVKNTENHRNPQAIFISKIKIFFLKKYRIGSNLEKSGLM